MKTEIVVVFSEFELRVDVDGEWWNGRGWQVEHAGVSPSLI